MTENTTLTNLNLTTTDVMEIDRLTRYAPATDDLLQLTDWLAANGTAHLSVIERIELAEQLITRRRFLIGAGALSLGVITGCGPEETANAPTAATEAARRTFTHVMGETDVPVELQRVVTLSDQNALLPLWELGFRNIVGSVGAFDENGNPYFNRMAEQGFDPTGVEFVSSYHEPNLEVIAELKPDLIIGMPHQEELYDLLTEIAPTVLIDPFNVPLQEVMMRYGELVGLEEEAERLETEYRQKMTDLQEVVGAPSEVVISVISTAASGGAASGQFYAIGYAGHPVESILRTVGFARPAPQLEIEERTFYSIEVLAEHDADLLMRLTFRQGDPEAREENTRAVKESPLWEQLNAVQKDQAVDINGDATVGTAYAVRLTFIDTLIDLLEGLDTSGDLSTIDITTPTPAEE